jgi:hypothetical protein
MIRLMSQAEPDRKSITLLESDVDEILAEYAEDLVRSSGARSEEVFMQVRRLALERLPKVHTARALSGYIAGAIVDVRVGDLPDECKRGKQGAFDTLWEILEPFLTRVIRAKSLAHTRQMDDLLQVVRETILKGLASYSAERGSFYAWTRIVAANAASGYVPERLTAADPLVWDRIRGREERQMPVLPFRYHAPCPPASAQEEVVELALGHEPHEVLAFLLNRYLGHRQGEIVEQFGDQTLESLAETVARLGVDEREKKYLNRIVDRLRPSLTGTAPDGRTWGESRLRDLWDPAKPEDSVKNWSAAPHRSAVAAVIQQAKRFLRSVCELKHAAAYEKPAFFWRHFLRRSVTELIPRFGCGIDSVADDFQKDCASIDRLTEDQVRWATVPWREQARRFSPRPLGTYYPGEMPTRDLEEARMNVQVLVEERAADWGCAAYAYLRGCFTRGTDPGRGDE